jgi:hypothetical protein
MTRIKRRDWLADATDQWNSVIAPEPHSKRDVPTRAAAINKMKSFGKIPRKYC